MSTVVAVLLLAAAAFPLGRRLAAGLPPAPSPSLRLATELCAGLVATAGLVHSAVCLGIPLPAAFGLAACLGAAALLFGPSIRANPAPPTLPRAFAPLLAVVVLSVAVGPLVEGAGRAPRRNDAEFIWLPKAERLLEEPTPIPWSSTEHAHAEYPRGWPALIAASGAFSQPVPDVAANAIGVAFFVLVLLALADAAATRGRPWAGLVAAAILGVNPEWTALSVSGLADLPFSAALLLVVIASPRDDDGAPILAAASAFGAACLKDEGWILVAVVAMSTFVRAASRRSWRPLVPIVAITALLLPWVVLRAPAGSRTTVLLPWIPENLGFLARRIPETASHLFEMAFGGGTTYPEFPGVAAGRIAVFPLVVVAGFAALVGGGPFRLRIPIVSGLAAFAVWCVTPDPLRWHVWTSADRIACQLAPAVVLAGACALWPKS